MKRRLAVLPLLLIVALSGCGSDGGDDGIATAGETAEPEADGGNGAGDLSEEERHEMELEFAACMRDHGIDMEDPEPGEGIQLQIEGEPAQADAAMEACRHLLPDGGEPPEPNPEEQEQMLAFAECMRENGFPEFPDPEEGGGIHIDENSGIDLDDPAFEAAEEKCQEEQGLKGERQQG